MKELSIVIVSYNTVDLTLHCLKSIEDQHLHLDNIECFVVDNGSRDDSVVKVKKGFPWVSVIQNKQNLGFAAANNIAIKISTGKYILLLNSDTVVKHETFNIMVQRLEKDPMIGAATPKIELTNGKVDPACHRGFPTPWNAFCYFIGLERLFPNIKIFAGYHLTYKNMHKTHEVDAISGACFFIPKKVINDVGLLDEQFFMYAEDIDWCKRIKEKGYKILYIPEIQIRHYKKQSGRSKTYQNRESEVKKIQKEADQHFYQTMLQFYDKHYQYQYPKWVRSAVAYAVSLKIKQTTKEGTKK